MLARMGYIISRKRIITLVTFRYRLHKPATHEAGYISFLMARQKKINFVIKPYLESYIKGECVTHKVYRPPLPNRFVGIKKSGVPFDASFGMKTVRFWKK